MSVALATTWEQRLADLGHVPASRILLDPAPGTGTIDDVIRRRDFHHQLCELVDCTLVEKSMGWQESLLAGVLLQWLNNYLDAAPLGVATGPDGMIRLFGDVVRGPDIAFFSWQRLPGRKIPTDSVPDLVPDFVIEILSSGNTYGEMSRKRREYFHAGVELLWIIDPRERSVTVYRSIQQSEVVADGEKLSGDPVLSGWVVDSGELFGKLDREG